MSRIHLIASALALATYAPPGLSQAAPTAMPATAPATVSAAKGDEGAASLYRQAFAHLDNLSEEDANRLSICGADACQVVCTPLDAATRQFLTRLTPAVELARKGAKLPEAHWAIGGDVQKLLELVSHAPHLSALLVLQARQELAAGQTDQAVDDLFVALTLARHVATAEPTVMNKMIEMAATRPPMELLARQLPSLPREVVATLPRRLDQLPASPTMGQVIRAEFNFGRQNAADQGLVTAIMISGLKDFYAALADQAALPPADFAKVVDKELIRFSLNPWAKVIGPTLKRSRESIAIFEAKSAMLRTAVDVVLNGDRALADSKDPFSPGPFAYRAFPGGFELSSKLRAADRAVKLLVGGEQKGR